MIYQKLPTSPGKWLCKIITKDKNSEHFISLDIREILETTDLYSEYLSRKNDLLKIPPPYICFLPTYLKNSGVGNNVIMGGDWIFHIFKNWNYKTKEEFLNWKFESIGSPWIEECTLLGCET